MYAQKTLAALLVALAVILATGCVAGPGRDVLGGGPSLTRPTSPAVAEKKLPPRKAGPGNFEDNMDLYKDCETQALSAWKTEVSGVAGGIRVAGLGAIGLASMIPLVGGVVGGGSLLLAPMLYGAKAVTDAGVQSAQSKKEAALAECRRKYLQ